jgi:hypothetical protein
MISKEIAVVVFVEPTFLIAVSRTFYETADICILIRTDNR